MPREKSSRREKRSSSYSSDSSYERQKSKSKHKRRSRSRDRSPSTSHKRKDSVSRSKHRRRSYSRSVSRDRYESKSKRSTSLSRSKRRSTSRTRSKRARSRERSPLRSRSRSRSKYSKTSKHKTHKQSPSTRSSSYEIERPVLNKKVNLDDTESKVEKAIKAAEAAGLTMTKIPTYEYKEVEIKEDMPSIHDRNLIAELNSDSFVQKSFTSSKSKKHQNIVIDLDTDTVKLPDVDLKVPSDDYIVNFDALPSEEELQEMWIRKLYLYRKKMLKGEI